MSDEVHSNTELGGPADSWLTNDDSEVTQTTGASVCAWHLRMAYILFFTGNG